MSDRDNETHRNALRWFFEDRATGRIVVGQMPNLTLWIVLAAWAVEVIVHPAGKIGLAVRLVKLGALTIWALDEMIRGVNPWRRTLGAALLVYVLVTLAKAATAGS